MPVEEVIRVHVDRHFKFLKASWERSGHNLEFLFVYSYKLYSLSLLRVVRVFNLSYNL